MIGVETSSNLAFCVISNAIAGIIARPRRTRSRNITETSIVAGCLATVIAIAFHDALWSAFTAGPLTTAALVSLTLGAGRSSAAHPPHCECTRGWSELLAYPTPTASRVPGAAGVFLLNQGWPKSFSEIC